MSSSLSVFQNHRTIRTVMSIGAVCAVLCGIAHAESFQIQSLSYQDGGLAFVGSPGLPKPRFEHWPSANGEMVILTFPNARGDINALQKEAESVLLKHPAVRQLMVSAEKNDLVLVLEKASDKKMPVLNESALLNPAAGLWKLLLEPAVPGQSQISPIEALSKSVSQVHKEPRQVDLPSPDGAHKNPDQEMKALLDDLNRVMRERDQLESQLVQLKLTLAQAMEKKTEQEDTLIRQYSPAFDAGRTPESVVISNLKKSLLHVSAKLKATETALTKQQEKTLALAHELAHLKNDPSMLSDSKRSKLIVAVEDPSSNSDPQPGTSHKNPEPPPAVIYHPSTTPSSSLPGKPEEEVYLQAAIHENAHDYPAYLRLADWYAGRNELEKSESLLAKLLALNPQYASGYYYLSMVYVGQKRRQEAEAALTTYKRLNPKDASGIETIRDAIKALPEDLQPARNPSPRFVKH